MSSLTTKTNKDSFLDQYQRGAVTADAIDDFIEIWHAGADPIAAGMSLHEFLGMTWEEYKLWVQDPDALPRIVRARRIA